MQTNNNFDKFADILKQKAAEMNDNLEKAISLCCEKVKGDIQHSMSHTKRDMSKNYYTNNKTKAHHPSLPGNPPAPDTKALRDSINFEVHKENRKVYGVVGSKLKNPDYAVYTEYGTSKMAPRPWLAPAMKKDNQFIKKTIAKAVKDTLEGGK